MFPCLARCPFYLLLYMSGLSISYFLIHSLTAVYDIQVKEMGESNRPSDLTKVGSEQFADKKKGFTDWMRLMRPQNVEKDHWV